MGALQDCEAFVDLFWGQPANAASALGFVVAGVLIVIRSRWTWVGVASIATGIGSFLFHGPAPGYSEWAHDASLAWLLLVVAGAGRSWERWTHLRGLAAVAVLCAIPGTADPLAAVLAIVAVTLILSDVRSVTTIGPVCLLVAVAILGRLGATGGPLCEPESLLQPHAIWHLGAAAALTWWAIGSAPRET